MVKDNPKLAQNIITEALLELRFESTESKDYTLVVGPLHEKLQQDYPKYIDLKIPDFGAPAPKDFDYIPRHRFSSSDESKVYSLGRGLLSVNILQYDSYKKFVEEVNKVVTDHKRITGVTSLTRIGMRYINRIDEGAEEKITIDFTQPPFIKEQRIGFEYQNFYDFGQDKMKARYFMNPETNQFFLDFDYFTELGQNYEFSSIEKWMNLAHNKIYNFFVSSIKEEYYQKLLNG